MFVPTARCVAPAIVLSLGIASTGCWIPTVDVANPGVPTVVDFEPGVTTAAEVRRALGDPTEFERPDVWVYEWTKGSGGVAIGAYYTGAWVPLAKNEFRVLFEFDRDGRLLRYQYDRGGAGITPSRTRRMATDRVPATTQRKCPAPDECYEVVRTNATLPWNATSTSDEMSHRLWSSPQHVPPGFPCGCSNPPGAASSPWVLASGRLVTVYDHVHGGLVLHSNVTHRLESENPVQQVNSCATDGDRLVTLHSGGKLILWSLADGSLIRSVPAPVARAHQVLWPAAEGPPLLFGASGQIATLDRETLELLASWSIEGDAPRGAWRDPAAPETLLISTSNGALFELHWPSLAYRGPVDSAEAPTAETSPVESSDTPVAEASPSSTRWQIVAAPEPWRVTISENGELQRVIHFVPGELPVGEALLTGSRHDESFQYVFLDDHRLLLSDHGLATVWDLDAMLPGEGTLEVGMLDPTAPSPRAVFLLPYGSSAVQVTMSDGP